MFQGKDLYICYWYMLYFVDNLCSLHIQACSPNKDLQNSLVNKYKNLHRLTLYRLRLYHMEMDYMDVRVLPV